MVTVVIIDDIPNTPLKKGQEVKLDKQTASFLVNIEKLAVYKEEVKSKKAK